MIMNNKNKVAIAALVIIILGSIIYSCSSKPEYDDLGNMIQPTTIEDIPYETTTMTETYTETTTDYTTSTETTTSAGNAQNVYIPNSTPSAAVDSHILCDDKRLELGMDMNAVKEVLGSPIVFIEETTEAATENVDIAVEGTTEAVTENVIVVEETTKNTTSHRYREFILTTKMTGGKETVNNIEVISPNIKNISGFSPIGKPLYEITLAYGEPAYSDWSVCKYNIDEKSYLYFNLYDGVVDTWGIAIND